ncbi:MAG: thioredoxin family protein [Novosphingobium sp.]
MALLLTMGLAAPAIANHIAATLVAEGPGAPGGTVMLAFDMKPEPGWHGYWSNPGDAGFGMSLDWSLPERATAGAPRYPVPSTLLVAGLMNHVYESEYAVLVPLVLPPDAQPGTRLPIRVKADWLACTDRVCVPEKAELVIELPIVAAADSSARKDLRFAEWTRLLPAPLGAHARFAAAGEVLRIGIPLPASVALTQPHFFPSEDGLVAYAAPQRFSRNGDVLIVELARRSGSDAPRRVAGVLRLNEGGDGLAIEAEPGAVPARGAPLATARSSLPSLPLLLVAALAGGLLLNVMPCVFPILSLKALSLARAGENARQARHEGLAYTAGVVLACVALGALLLILRAAGQEVGWAFQLQEPGVVAALLLLAVVITSNLLGLFEFSVPGFASEGSPQGAFATGLLAAFVATPCTGPFMAAAMGAALLLPVPAALALFAAMGLGIALPFLAIAFVPALRRRLPRPGRWMVRFRRWMALPMGLTALALLWLASRLGGWSFAAATAALAVMVVVLLAWIGKGQRAGLGTARLAGGAIALAGVGLLLLPAAVRAPSASAQGILPARPFSEAALAAARADGKPVFAWFTADWCLTCKVNEELAIERPEVRDAFARAGVVVLRGDWTRRDPAITRYLTAQGAAGVPLYVWYPGGGGAPRRLPQVLTPTSLTGLVSR